MATPKDRKAAQLGRFFSQAKFEKVLILDGEDVYEVRQPTVSQRSRITKASQKLVPVAKKNGYRAKDGDEEFTVEVDSGELQMKAVLECVFLPDDSEPFFGPEHRESLAAMPVGGLYDKLAKAALKLMNFEPEEAAKNSDATPSAASSSV